MSNESIVMEHREEDVQAAAELVKESEYLSKDEFANSVVENGGKLPDGTFVKDLGNFLKARQDYIMSEVSKSRFEGRVRNNPDLMVVSSVRPDVESYL
jgi:hypothetical protein